MTVEIPLTRRSTFRVTTAATGAVCALALAGCSSAASSSQDTTPESIPTGGTPYRVGKASELPVGTTGAGTANGVDVVLFRADETTVLAYTDVCTHAGCTIAPNGEDFKCPCHSSIFKGSDGTVVSGPARASLTRFAAAIDGDWITVSL